MGMVEDMARAFLDAHAETQRQQVADAQHQNAHPPLCRCYDCTQARPRNLDCIYCQQLETVDYDTLICANCGEYCYGARDARLDERTGYDCPTCGATDTDPDAADPETGDCVQCRERNGS